MTRANVLARWTRLVALAAAVLSGAVYAQPQDLGGDGDPPVRVGRVSYAEGQVSFSPAGNDQWVEAQVNRPVVTGDRLWSDSDSRAELAVDNSTWWLGDRTSVTVSNLDDRIVQMQVHEGTLDVRVRRLPADNIVEIDTPNLAFSVTRPGRYRVEVDPQDGSTMVVVRDGTGEVYGESASYVITAGQAYRFYGSDVSDSEFVELPPIDAFDRFALERDRRYNTVASARYVSPEVIGYEDLDHYGNWSVEATYGNVWFPRSVNAGWAPYREGHWTWIDPWGWTWVDDEPWGFAPFHYGRWAHFSRGWGWVPGPRSVRPVYAPALVAFVGGAGFSIAVSSGPAIGWFPLAPREVYVPPYRVSRNYFRQVNVSNTVVNVTNITNIYNNPARASEVTYANRRAPDAVTAVPPAAFAQAQNVRRAAIQLPAAAIQRAEVRPVAPVAPARPSMLGAGPVARAKPPAAAMQRVIVAKVPPPPPPIADVQKLQALEKNPGRPLDRAQLQSLRRAAPPAAVAPPTVKLVEQPKPAVNAAPPARAAGAQPPGRANVPPAGAVPGSAGRATPAPGAAKGAPGGRGAEAGAGAPDTAAPATPGGAAIRSPEARGPAGAPPASAPDAQRTPVARPPEARGPASRPAPAQERSAPDAIPAPPAASGPPGRPQGGPPGQAGRAPAVRAPQAEPSPAERAAPSRPPEARPQAAPEPRAAPRPPEARPQPQPQRVPEARPQPAPEPRAAPRPPEARPQPQPQRTPEARPQPAPEPRAAPRPPEARPQPQPQRTPEARPQPAPEPRAAPRPPEARPQPQRPAEPPPAAPRPPEARGAPPPQAAPRPPEARGGPPPGKEDKGKGNDRKEPNG